MNWILGLIVVVAACFVAGVVSAHLEQVKMEKERNRWTHDDGSEAESADTPPSLLARPH